MRLSENARALLFLGRTGASLLNGKMVDEGPVSIARRFRNGTVWGTKAKPLAAYRRRLCCLCTALIWLWILSWIKELGCDPVVRITKPRRSQTRRARSSSTERITKATKLVAFFLSSGERAEQGAVPVAVTRITAHPTFYCSAVTARRPRRCLSSLLGGR